jgi:methenyltetrahydromethanopterin cyclohydrolase
MGGVMTPLGMNERAWAIADACERDGNELRIAVQTLSCGARVIDAGVSALVSTGSTVYNPIR